MNIKTLPSTPKTETELLNRAQQLAGMTLGELAAIAGIIPPPDLNVIKVGLVNY